MNNAEEYINELMGTAKEYANNWAREDARLASVEGPIFEWPGWVPGESPFYMNLAVKVDESLREELSVLAHKAIIRTIETDPEHRFVGMVLGYAKEGLNVFDELGESEGEIALD